MARKKFDVMNESKKNIVPRSPIISFIRKHNHDTCNNDKANYTGATGTNKENHHDDHDNMVTAANSEDEPRGGIPETSSLQLVDDTTSTLPATIILPATITSPPPAAATASAKQPA